MNHEQIQWKILDVFRECDVQSFPINIFKLIEHYGYEVCEYSDQPTMKQAACMDISEDAFRLKKCVYYNDTVAPFRRRFSLAHELGHIILKHTEPYTLRMENEANYFASNILAPRIAIHYAQYRNATHIENRFNLSRSASKIAYEDYLQWRYSITQYGIMKIDQCMYNHFYDDFKHCFVWHRSICPRCHTDLINQIECGSGECEKNLRGQKCLDAIMTGRLYASMQRQIDKKYIKYNHGFY